MYEFYGWEIKEDPKSVNNLVDNLCTLDDQELLHVILFSTLRGIPVGNSIYSLTLGDTGIEKEKGAEASSEIR